MKRICSYILVFVLIATLFTGIPVKGDTYYNGSTAIAWDQRNSAWSGNVYGTGTIYDTACGVLSTCNAINYLHGSFNTTEKAKAFVLDWASYAYSIGGFNPGGSDGMYRYVTFGTEISNPPPLQTKYGTLYNFTMPILWTENWNYANTYNGYSYNNIYVNSQTALKNYLTGDSVAIAHVPGHFICLADYDPNTDKFLVLDSYPTNARGTLATNGVEWVSANELSGGRPSLTVGGFCVLTSTMAAASADMQLRSCDNTGWQNSPRGEFYNDSTTYTEGTGCIRIGLDKRSGTKIMNAWLGSIDGRNANTDTISIVNAINDDGAFYITMDFWADEDILDELNAGRFVLGVYSYTSLQPSNSMDYAKEALQIEKKQGADWSVWGIEKLQPGWNHLAVKVTDVNGACNFAHPSNSMASYWDASRVWGVKFNYQQLNWEDPADYTYSIRVDDIRFMSVEYYEDNFVSRNQVKDVVTAIAEIENKNDTSGIAAASAAYNALTAKQKAQVSNYKKLEEVGLIVDEQLHDCEGDFSTGTVLLPGGIYTTGDIPALENECYTQGNGAAGITWNNLDNKKLHTSFINYDEAGWDFSKATYLAFDMYVHGVKSVWSVGNGDQNICFGGSSMWNSSDLGTIGNANMQTLVSSQLQEGWNHVVISIPASARVDGVKNIHLYFENCLEFTADDPCVIFDDVRVLNENGLLIDQVRSVAKPVISQIAELPATDRMTLQDKGAVDAARVAYNGLSDQVKEYVTNLADLVAAEDRIVVLQNQEIADKAAAQAVDAMIAALPAVNSLTLNDKAAVNAARDAYQELTLTQRTYVNNLGLLEAAEAKLSALQKQEADDKAAAQAVDAMIAALPAVNALTLNDKGAVVAAGDSYNALNDNAKGYVTNLADLQAAQAQIALLEEQLSDENAPAFVIENITARAGDTITVAVKIKNNPGIVSAKVKVAYDADVLEVLSLEAGDFDGITFSPVTNNPLVFNWMDSIHPNNTTNGALAYITFKVKDTAAVGTTPLTITYDGDDVFDFDYNNVAFGKVNGVVTIAEYTPGDVNDDGAIDNKDLALIQRYLNDWDSTLNEAAADVNRNGELNNKDYSTLERYLNGWDVVLA